MSETSRGIVQAIEALWGGAITTMAAAIAGRLMYHSGEVRARRRRFFGPEILWEAPVAVGMAIIGEAVAAYVGVAQPVSTGVVAVLAYLGPRWFEAVLGRFLDRWIGGAK